MKWKRTTKLILRQKESPSQARGFSVPKRLCFDFFRIASTPPKTFVFDASRPKSRLNSLSLNQSVETASLKE